MAQKGLGKQFEVRRPECAVWLGGLPLGVSHTELLPILKQVGNCKHVRAGKNGTGFAYFSSPEEVEAAISSLNGTEIEGSVLQVDHYAKKPAGKGGSNAGKGRKQSWSPKQVSQPMFQKSHVAVALLAQKERLKAEMAQIDMALAGAGQQRQQFGGKGKSKGKGKVPEFTVKNTEATVWIGNVASGVTHADLLPVMRQAGNCKRVQVTGKTGFAWFASADDAQNAITTLNGTSVMGQEIELDVYVKKGKK